MNNRVSSFKLGLISNLIHDFKAFKLGLISDVTSDYVSDRVVRLPLAVEVPAAVQVISEDTVEGHPLVQFAGRKRAYKYCAKQRRRMAAGRYVETSYGCSTCHIYLCRMGQCFLHVVEEHHILLISISSYFIIFNTYFRN